MENKLFNKNFILLWLGQSLSQLGNGAGFLAVMWWIQTTTGSALALGTLAMIQSVIGICTSPFAGAFADRFDKKKIIVITDLLRGIIYCFIAWTVITNQLTIPILYIAMAMAAVCSQFFHPAISSSIPLLVPDSQLERANSLNQVTVNLVNIAGYAAGGILIATVGIPALLVINGISFIFSAFSETFITIPSIPSQTTGQRKPKFLDDVKTGFKYVKENNILFKIMQVAMVLNFFYAPYFILLPKFVNEYMGAGSEVYGFIMSAQMVGALTATLLISLTPIIKNNLWLVKWSLIVQCSLLLTLPFLPGALWGLHITVFAVGGLFNAILNIYFGALMQRVTTPEHRGKVFGLLNTMSSSLQPLSQGLTGIVADAIRLPIIFTVCGLASGAGGVQFASIKGLDDFLSGKTTSSQAKPQTSPAPAA